MLFRPLCRLCSCIGWCSELGTRRYRSLDGGFKLESGKSSSWKLASSRKYRLSSCWPFSSGYALQKVMCCLQEIER